MVPSRSDVCSLAHRKPPGGRK